MALCSPQQLNDLSTCFSCLSPKQLRVIKALAILSFADEFDPTIDDSVQALIDATGCLGSCGTNDPTLLAAETAIWIGLANAQGAEMPVDPTVLANMTVGLDQLSDAQLHGVELLALCGTTIPVA